MTSVDRKVNRHLNPSAYGQPLPTHAPLIPLAEMVRRIEAARLEAGPGTCSTCGSSVPVLPETKWCPDCRDVVPVELFSRDASRHNGLRAYCKPHDAARMKAWRSKVAKRRAS